MATQSTKSTMPFKERTLSPTQLHLDAARAKESGQLIEIVEATEGEDHTKAPTSTEDEAKFTVFPKLPR
jgi:hypothetical protein